MDNLLLKLISDLSLLDQKQHFEEMSITKTVVSKNSNRLTIYLKSLSYINIQVIDRFVNELNSFFDFNDVKIEIDVEEAATVDIITSYFKYVARSLQFSQNIENVLVNRNLEVDFENKEVRILVHNHYEYEAIAKSLEIIEVILNNYGLKFNFLSFEIEHELELDDELQQILEDAKNEEVEVKKEEVKVVVNNTNMLYGKKIGRVTHKINLLETNSSNICIEGEVFQVDSYVTKTEKVIVTIYVTDYTNSISGKLFLNKDDKNLKEILALKGKYIKMYGHVTYDSYARCDVIRIMALSKENNTKQVDDAPIKRNELHIHTMMSAVDSVVDVGELVDFALENNYSAIGVVDHNSVQAFPALYNQARGKDIKVIYGTELSVVDPQVKLIVNNNNEEYHKFDDTYVVFDLETTGLNPFGGDRIIEFGAAKIRDGEIIETFQKLCNPGIEISREVTEITGIKNSMILNEQSDKVVLKEFLDWVGDLPLVAHNAEFDFNFLVVSVNLYGYDKLQNSVIDTLAISRALHPEWGRHGLAALAKRYKVSLENHHRASDDATATAHIFNAQLQEIKKLDIEHVSDINNIVDTSEAYKFSKPFHLTILVKNNVGLKNLFKLISLANTKYFHKEPRILRSEITAHREGLIIGSSCVNGEIFQSAQKLSEIELGRLMEFYDYIEVQSPEVYSHLIQTSEFENIFAIEKVVKKIVDTAINSGKLVIASGDVHHLRKRDKILREIIINYPAPGGGFHPLKNRRITELPSQHFRSTNEMLEDFSFLNDEVAQNIVIDNTQKIVDLVEEVEIIKSDLYTPKLENSATKTKDMVYQNARAKYGEELPKIVVDRIEKELSSITGHGFDVIYLISSQLVEKSLEDGYLVGSRGSVGSSLVATFMNITEINPLQTHYICPNCKYSEFVDDEQYSCGYDLPKKECPNCGTTLDGEGHDIPFETFLGFDGDKVPDIDLNFSGEYQARAHNYTKELFGEEYVYRAGTISTIAEKTAFGYVKGYESDTEVAFNNAEITRLAAGCQGVKRSTGQHPGGILVVPSDKDIFDFTPIQYPADDTTSEWYTTHFDFHAIHDNILKLDILGHDDPTVLYMLTKISDIDSRNVDFARDEVIEIFSSAAPLGIKPRYIQLDGNKTYTLFSTGTLGVPEFGTRFVIEMLNDTKPKSFAELVKISGLSHGTDVWLNNGQYLIRNNICEFREIIGCRDDIMVYLMQRNIPQNFAFKIMEDVRKGKGLTAEYIDLMKSHDVPSWYIDSCNKIKYMFPKAHASAYVLMAMRIAYFKVFHPIYYYCVYFSIRCSDFEIHTMVKGKEAILERIEEILRKEFDASAKEKSVLNTLEIGLEMLDRGFHFENIDLDTSKASEFVVKGNGLLPPFTSIDGLGLSVAQNIVKERDERIYTSIEDLKTRGKVSKSMLTKFELMDIIEHLPEGDQMTLF